MTTKSKWMLHDFCELDYYSNQEILRKIFTYEMLAKKRREGRKEERRKEEEEKERKEGSKERQKSRRKER